MKKYLSVALLGILLGCSDRHEGGDGMNVIKSDRVKSVCLADLSRCGGNDMSGFAKHGNKLVVGATCSMASFARDINLENPEQVEQVATRSISPATRLRSFSSFCSFDGSSVTALDFKAGELVERAVTPLARGNEGRESVIRLPRGKQHLIAVKANDFVLSTGLYEEGRYLLYSPVDGTARYFLSYPETPEFPDLREGTKAMLYASSVLRVCPDQVAFVCADMHSGLIDFCRIEGDGIERVKTVRLHYPKVKISESPSLQVAYRKDNRFGFMDVAVTGERVYALYSGKSYRVDRERVFECQTLLVYDWEGNLERSVVLDTALHGIAYDREENALYGITCDSKMVALENLEINI